MRNEEKQIEVSNEADRHPLGWILSGLFVGSLIGYYFDSISGRKRRAHFRDRLEKSKNEALWYSKSRSRDLANRFKGVVYESSKMFKTQLKVDDETLVQRVRSAMGRKIRHPKAIDVQAKDGCVTVSGYVLKDEVKHFIELVAAVPGVHEVVNRLEVHDVADNIPSLQ
jgi:osmotically-inducible protein OsmY